MADRLHLQPKHRDVLEALLREHLPDVEVWVYGSRVSGRSHDGSDLDLVLRGPGLEEIPIGQLGDFEVAVRESTIPFLVEARDWARLPERFHREIAQDHVVWRDAASSNSEDGNWLYHPEFPTHWERKPLYSMAQWVNGLAFRNIQFSSTGKPVIKIGEIKGGISGQTKFTHQTFDESVRVRNGDLLFSWSGQPETSIDAFWWRGEEGWLNQHVFRVTPNTDVDVVFFYYLLRYLRPNFVGIARNKQTTGLGHVTKRDVADIVVGQPKLSEQRAIAHILGTLDDKIELNRRMNETLEAMARALFKSWFVDFDPVRAKMEGRAPGLPKPLADLFPDRLVDSEIGEIPDGWKVRPLGEQVTVSKGLSYKGAGLATPDCGMPFHNLNSIEEGGGYKPDGLKSRRDYSGEYRQRHVAQPGALIVANTEQGFDHLLIGYSAIVPEWSGPNALFSHHIFLMKMMPESPLSELWLHYAISATWIGEAIRRFSNGTTVNMLPADAFRLADTIVPPRKVVDAFSKVAGPMLKQQEHAVVCSRNLAALRDRLLPRLISGNIRLPETEKMEEAVT